MPQNFSSIASSTKLQDSLTPLLDRDEAARSCYSGTSFPSSDLVLGMLCYRTDTGSKGLYQLTQITPTVVWEPMLGQTSNDARYVRLAGGATLTGHLTFDATGGEKQLIFNPSATTGRTVYLFSRPSDEGTGLWSTRNAKAVWTYYPATDTFDFGTVTLTRNGSKVWHADNDGVASGLDADLLDGQHGSYYLNYNNLTNRPALSDAASTTVAAIQAGVNLSGRLSKSGDTMTGYFGFAASIWNPSSDGQNRLYFLANSHTYYRTAGDHYFRNGSDADTIRLAASGDIWTNTYGWLHDRFANRTPVSGTGAARTTGVCGDYALSSGYEIYDTGNGQLQVRQWVQNCTASSPANCSSGGSGGACVFGGTLVALADGTLKPVEAIVAGDLLDDGLGGTTEVVGLHMTTLGFRMGIVVNGVRCTADHPLRGSVGWRAVDVSGVYDAAMVIDTVNGEAVFSGYDAINGTLRYLLPDDNLRQPMSLGGGLTKARIDYLSATADTPVFSPIVRGEHATFVAGGLIHGALRVKTQKPLQPVAVLLAACR